LGSAATTATFAAYLGDVLQGRLDGRRRDRVALDLQGHAVLAAFVLHHQASPRQAMAAQHLGHLVRMNEEAAQPWWSGRHAPSILDAHVGAAARGWGRKHRG
jgi:hypothetical protein